MPWNEVMHKWGAGTLKSGSGAPVKSQKQALAIMYSEKRAAANGKSEYKAKRGYRAKVGRKINLKTLMGQE